MSEAAPITFHANLVKAQTMADGGWRVTLDIPMSSSASVLELAKMGPHVVLGVAIVPEESAG